MRRGGLPSEVRSLLQRARQALGRGQWGETDRLAKRSLRIQQSRRAFALMAMAQCGRKNLRLAKAWYHRAGAGYRRMIQRFCQRHGIEVAAGP
jgi:hypothetical protein